jgi:DNA-directed RNA polymerase specialized sigma24 family protein
MLDLEAALQQLEERSPRIARVAELRLFGGLTFDEAAAATGTSATSVKRDWKLAQLLLTQALRGRHTGA